MAALALASSAAAGETRCSIDQGALTAPVAFGDIAGDFLIDLSAPTSALHQTRAEEDGLTGPAARRDLVIGGRRLRAVTLAIVDLDARTARFETTVNGVIGADLLRRFVVEIDPAACRLRLLRHRPRAWRGGGRLPLREVAGQPLVPARVSDGARVRDGLFALDTADWETTVGGARLSRPQPAGAPAPVRLRAVEFAGQLLEQAPAAVRPDAGDAAPVDALGMAVLSRWRLRVDIAGGRLELAPAGR